MNKCISCDRKWESEDKNASICENCVKTLESDSEFLRHGRMKCSDYRLGRAANAKIRALESNDVGWSPGHGKR